MKRELEEAAWPDGCRSDGGRRSILGDDGCGMDWICFSGRRPGHWGLDSERARARARMVRTSPETLSPQVAMMSTRKRELPTASAAQPPYSAASIMTPPGVSRRSRWRWAGILAVLALVVLMGLTGPAVHATTGGLAPTASPVTQQKEPAPLPAATSGPADPVPSEGDVRTPPSESPSTNDSMTTSILVILAFFLVAFGGFVLILRSGLRSSAHDDHQESL